jgi:hypothetical protein
MDPSFKNVLIFTGIAIVGMFAHYGKSWAKGEISGNLVDYLFRDNPRATVLSIGGVLAAVATTYATGTLTGLTLQQLLMSGFTTGFAIDSTLNKGGFALPPAAPAAPAAKQAGFARIGLLLGMLMLSACAALGLRPQTMDQTLLEAESTATAALQMSTGLLINHTITLAQDQLVRKSHDVVIAAAHTGHSAIAAGDPAKAQAEIDAIQADLALLQSFISSHQ